MRNLLARAPRPIIILTIALNPMQTTYIHITKRSIPSKRRHTTPHSRSGKRSTLAKPQTIMRRRKEQCSPTSTKQSDSRLVHQLPEPEKYTLEDFVHRPLDAVKSTISEQGNHQVAANVVAKEVPHGKEVDIVNTYAAVNHATTHEEKLVADKELSMLLRERQST